LAADATEQPPGFPLILSNVCRCGMALAPRAGCRVGPQKRCIRE
jgi:hypothetical protein